VALTSVERAETRRLLGFWDQTRGLYHRLEGRMSGLSTEAEDQVRAWLAEIAAIELQMADARACRLKVRSITSDDESIVLLGWDEIEGLRNEGNRLVRQIATVLGVDVLQYPFASAGMAGMTNLS